MQKIYGYAKCSTCKKAEKFMKSKKLAFTSEDITKNPPSKRELKDMLAVYDGEIKKLLNTSGVMYREMELSKKLPNMSDHDVLELLAQHGKLIKRPFLVVDKKAQCVGFKEDEWKKALL